MVDSGLQRLNMVESQVRTSDVTDRRILKAMLEVPREAFVPAQLGSLAYMDEPLPVESRANGAASGRRLLAPRILAKLIQLAEIDDAATVLDVGCATGYSTAVLAKIARRVIAIESDHALVDFAARSLQGLGISNATVKQGPLPLGAASEGPFDAIVLNGAVPAAPPDLLQQLKDGGRLVAIIAEGALSRAHVMLRTRHVFDTRAAFEATASPLPGFEKPQGFVF